MKQKSKLSTFFSKNFVTILTFIGLYLLSAGSSWIVFSYAKGGESSEIVTGENLNEVRSRIDTSLPKTEECPINGKMFTKQERDIWESKRPIAAMIENSTDARPQSGLSSADVVYEAVAESGITRFLAIFYCGVAAQDTKIAPVRSARVYFINWAQEYGNNPLYVHVGGANNYGGDTAKEVRALELLESLGWRVPKGNDFDTTYDSGYPVFWRNYERLDHPVDTEHTMMSSTDAIYAQAEQRGFTATKNGKAWDENYIAWKFKEGKSSTSPEASNISFKFWDNWKDYDVEWKYDSTDNLYFRSNGGKPHTDLEADNKQISASNVVVMSVIEKGPLDVHKHMFYQNIGQGKVVIFQNGQAIEGTWKKASTGARTRFFDNSGTEVEFVKGTIWIEAVPAGNDINY